MNKRKKTNYKINLDNDRHFGYVMAVLNHLSNITPQEVYSDENPFYMLMNLLLELKSVPECEEIEKTFLFIKQDKLRATMRKFLESMQAFKHSEHYSEVLKEGNIF